MSCLVVVNDAARGHRSAPHGRPEVVYLPACVNTMFGGVMPGEKTTEFAIISLLTAAGIGVTVPEGINSLCCGTPWKSKGMTQGYATMRRRVVDIMRQSTRDGELTVISDAVSCSEGFVHELEYEGVKDIRVVDAVQYVADGGSAYHAGATQGRVGGTPPNMLVNPDGLERLVAALCRSGGRRSRRRRRLGLLRVRWGTAACYIQSSPSQPLAARQRS